MSKLFYDHLVDLGELEKLVKKHVKSEESRHEIYKLIDEIVHHRVVGCILDRLPERHHREFLDQVHRRAYDEGILDYLRERVTEDVEEFIRREVYLLGTELLEMFVKPHEKVQGTNLH